jgi:hypothetical protein
MDITLLSESDFDVFVRNTSSPYEKLNSSLCNPDVWDKYFDISKKYSTLNEAIKYIKNDFWNIFDDKLKLRKTLFFIKSIRKELNPAHKEHLAILVDLIAIFSIAINRVTIDTFNQYLLPDSKEKLSRELKIWIWGGMDQHQYWNKLYRLAFQRSSDENDIEIELPMWEDFVQLIRQCLEEPYSTSNVPLLLRELAFEYIDDQQEECFSKKLATENPQAAKFALMICSYICKATKLPKDFDQILSSKIVELMS